MDLTTFTHFMGWSLGINIGLLLISTIMVCFFKQLSMGFHKKLFNVSDEFLAQSYFNYLARYKLLIIVFNLVPYMVLRLAL
ncbi:MAG: hypothetical protein CMH31_03905 [Micavibrio sp.]|nr:hypothetical protein [Micavibrio sp.]|tara:strand:+ start:912 stop:1154 length:243 start_codon:yes stop_codon:yes gene_type:complete